MSQPTREEIICAHETLGYLCDCLEMGYTFGPATIKASKNAIEKALLPKPKRTMAEIQWDSEEHYLAEAKHPQYERVIMIEQVDDGLIEVLIPEHYPTKIDCLEPESLTPTGCHYALTQPQEN